MSTAFLTARGMDAGDLKVSSSGGGALLPLMMLGDPVVVELVICKSMPSGIYVATAADESRQQAIIVGALMKTARAR